MITPNEALHRCIEHREIFHDEMLHLMRMLMRGEMSPTIAAALLMGLRVKKETVGEITAAAEVMREFATPVGSARSLGEHAVEGRHQVVEPVARSVADILPEFEGAPAAQLAA